MKAKIIAIGTSRGIRIPKYLLEKYGIEEQVEVEDTGKGIMICPIKKSREGWEAAFKKAADAQNNLSIEMPASDWDTEEWHW